MVKEMNGSHANECGSSGPIRSPGAVIEMRVDAILTSIWARRFGSYRLAPIDGAPRSTLSDIVRQDGPTGIRSAMSGSVPARSFTST